MNLGAAAICTGNTQEDTKNQRSGVALMETHGLGMGQSESTGQTGGGLLTQAPGNMSIRKSS